MEPGTDQKDAGREDGLPVITDVKLGGNRRLKEVFKLADTATSGMAIRDKYSTTVAEDYRDRLSAEVNGVEWVKRERHARADQSGLDGQQTQRHAFEPRLSVSQDGPTKAENEAYFAKMGSINSQRSSELPPSQGGKFSGFGSSVVDGAPRDHWDFDRSSMEDFANNSLKQVSKGWSFLNKWAASATSSVQDQLHEKGYDTRLSEFRQRVQEGARFGVLQVSKFVEDKDSHYEELDRQETPVLNGNERPSRPSLQMESDSFSYDGNPGSESPTFSRDRSYGGVTAATKADRGSSDARNMSRRTSLGLDPDSYQNEYGSRLRQSSTGSQYSVPTRKASLKEREYGSKTSSRQSWDGDDWEKDW